MRKSASFCRLQANRSKETPFLDLPYHFVCILHRKKEVIDVNLNDHFHAWLQSLGENPMQEAWTSHTLLSSGFLQGCAILVCDFHFPKNICKTVIVSISQKWVCDNRAVQKLPWSFYFHLPLWFSFLHMVFPFGINRYRAGAKVWQRALEIKGRAFGFRKNLHTVG